MTTIVIWCYIYNNYNHNSHLSIIMVVSYMSIVIYNYTINHRIQPLFSPSGYNLLNPQCPNKSNASSIIKVEDSRIHHVDILLLRPQRSHGFDRPYPYQTYWHYPSWSMLDGGIPYFNLLEIPWFNPIQQEIRFFWLRNPAPGRVTAMGSNLPL